MVYQIYGVNLPSGANTLLVRRAGSAKEALGKLNTTQHGQYDRIIMVSRARLSAMIDTYHHVRNGEAITIANMPDLGFRLGYAYFDPIATPAHGLVFWKYIEAPREEKSYYIRFMSSVQGRVVENPNWLGYLVATGGY